MAMAMADKQEAAMAIVVGKGSGAATNDGNHPVVSGCWAEMLPEALLRIFSMLPLEERMLKAPMVCKAWRRTAEDPFCWKAVDLHEWSRLTQWEVIHRMVMLVADRSDGRLEELSVCRLMSDEPVEYIARRGHALKVLRIPFCQVTDACICKIAPSLNTVTHLDISGCTMLTKEALSAIGRNCTALTRLDRNMSFFQTTTVNAEEKDDEAMAIAENMPLLRHLELCYGSLSNEGLVGIVDRCKRLDYLDLRGCMNLNIEESVAEKCRLLGLQVVHKHKLSDQFEIFREDDLDDDMSDVQDDIFSDGWDDEWYFSSDDIDVDDYHANDLW